jgi:hypothetical protein
LLHVLWPPCFELDFLFDFLPFLLINYFHFFCWICISMSESCSSSKSSYVS